MELQRDSAAARRLRSRLSDEAGLSLVGSLAVAAAAIAIILGLTGPLTNALSDANVNVISRLGAGHESAQRDPNVHNANWVIRLWNKLRGGSRSPRRPPERPPQRPPEERPRQTPRDERPTEVLQREIYRLENWANGLVIDAYRLSQSSSLADRLLADQLHRQAEVLRDRRDRLVRELRLRRR